MVDENHHFVIKYKYDFTAPLHYHSFKTCNAQQLQPIHSHIFPFFNYNEQNGLSQVIPFYAHYSTIHKAAGLTVSSCAMTLPGTIPENLLSHDGASGWNGL